MIVPIVVALTLDWTNSRAGCCVNLATVSNTDISFVLFVVLKWGHSETDDTPTGVPKLERPLSTTFAPMTASGISLISSGWPAC